MSQRAKRYAKRDPLWKARSLMRTTLSMFPCVVPDLLSTPTPNERPWLRMICLGRGELKETRIDRDGLRRVRHALRQLSCVEPAVLRRLSRDPVAWMERTGTLCDLIANRLDGQALTLDQVSRWCSPRVLGQFHAMTRDYPELRRWLGLVMQVEMTRRDGIDETRWKALMQNAQRMRDVVLAEDDLRLHLGLYQTLPSIHPKWFEFLVGALVSPELSEENGALLPRYSELANQVRKVLRYGNKTAKLPRPKLRAELQTHCRWLIHRDPKQVQAATRLLASLIDESTIDQVRLTLGGVPKATRELERAHAKAVSGDSMQYIVDIGGADAIERLLEGPAEIVQTAESLSLLRDHVRNLMNKKVEPQELQARSRFFEAISQTDWHSRLWWQRLFERTLPKSHSDCHRRSQQLLRSLGSLFARRGMPIQLRSADACEQLVEALAHYPVVGKNLTHFMAILRRVFYEQPPIKFHSRTVAAAATCAESSAEAVALVEAHARRGHCESNLYQMEYARVLATNSEQTFELLRWFAEAGLCNESLELLVQPTDPVLRRVIRFALRRGQRRRLERLLTHLRLINGVGRPMPELPRFEQDADWIKTYPEPLHEALIELNERCHDAVSVAADVLRQNFPAHDRMTRQIEFLRRRIDEERGTPAQRERMVAKIKHLRGYIADPPVPSPQRIANLIVKIRARCETWVAEAFEELCRTESLRFLVADRPTDISPRLSETPYRELLPAVLTLEGRSRTLGLRLLMVSDREKKNLAPLEPANERFLRKMLRRGLSMEPWLDAQRIQSVERQSVEYRLGFENNALELLLMGHHFSTCLSPHDTNFFSAVSNAIDINKQVLYCKTTDGQVVGRCLFALTDGGLIKTFCRYHHGHDLPFEEMVDAFAEDLAQQMGTGLTANGNVSNLVANEWYDDGPIPGGLSRILDGERPLSKVLKETSESSLEGDLRACFGTMASVIGNMNLVLQEMEESGTQHLIVPFIRMVVSVDKLSFTQSMDFAVRAHKLGATDLAKHFLDAQPRMRLLSRLRRFIEGPSSMCRKEVEEAIVGMLLEFDLRLAHRFLISTRPKKIRCDDDETSRFRRGMLAEIHRRRGRTERARRLSNKAV